MKDCRIVFFRCLMWISFHILFQSVCYYSASEGPGVQARMFSSLQEEMTSRVREGRRRKKAKNGDYEDELNSGDCEVFQCGAASLGHMAFRMYRGVSSLMELGSRGKEN